MTQNLLHVSESLLRYKVRAKYYPQPDGSYRLSTIQAFDKPFFRPAGWELDKADKGGFISDHADEDEDDDSRKLGNAERARRRARIATFDLVMSNPQLDTFITLTYAPDMVEDKADYSACYRKLRPFLSNAVQRRGLCYVGVPELTKKGDVHFHFLANSSALDLERAFSARTGRPLTHNGAPIYNLPRWGVGFSTAQLVENRSEGDARAACVKYVLKYINKQDDIIGGRYYLSGGVLARPVYRYGDAPEEFFEGQECTYDKAAKITTEGGEMAYTLWSYT